MTMTPSEQRPNKCRSLFACRLRRITVLLCTFAAVTTTTAAATDTANVPIGPATPLTEAALRPLLATLRHGDYDLVRPSPTEETEAKQLELCPAQLDALVATVVSRASTEEGSLRLRGLAAEGLALCTTNQPLHRAHIADNGIGIHAAIVNLAKDGWTAYTTADPAAHESLRATAVRAMAQAAEAIWILSYHSAKNVAAFLDAHAVTILGDIITGVPVTADNDHAYQPMLAAPAVMWSLAALQNVAANYCQSEDGSCHWTWNEEIGLDNWLDIAGEEPPLESPELADRARQDILAHANLLTTILQWTCAGPVSRVPDDTYTWPGSSVIIYIPQDASTLEEITPDQIMAQAAENAVVDNTVHLQSPSIVPWAAIGVLKNLLLGSADVRNAIKLNDHVDVLPCLCQHEHSPDWLERSKADDALYFWANPEHYSPHEDHDYCPHLYEGCMDYAGWEDHEGESCFSFFHNKWCLEYGDHDNEDGVTARQACCACGGGWRGDERWEHEHEHEDQDSGSGEEEYDSEEYNSDEEPEL